VVIVGIVVVAIGVLLGVHLAAAPTSAAAPGSAATPTPSAAPTPSPTTPAGVTSIAGTYTFTRQVLSCTGSGWTCPPENLPMKITCSASGSCVASSSHWGSSHAVNFNGTTISFSGIDVGVVACNSHPVPATLSFDLTVVSWKVGSNSVRSPQRIQGPYSFTAAAAGGCSSIQEKAIITSG
jgi:hypothetical protein